MIETEPEKTFAATVRQDASAIAALLRRQHTVFSGILAVALVLLMFSSRLPLFQFILSIVLAATLAALVVIDLDQFRLPDLLTVPLIAAGVILSPPHTLLDTLERLAAAMVGFALLYAVAEGYRWWRGHAGLGLGDAKLFAAAGAWVTLGGLPSVLLIAAVTALAVTLAVAYRDGAHLSRTTRIAFGPYLALGLWLVWLFGPLI
jgi:leader peptidase (prepilin peptidase) / N-methyltransferase